MSRHEFQNLIELQRHKQLLVQKQGEITSRLREEEAILTRAISLNDESRLAVEENKIQTKEATKEAMTNDNWIEVERLWNNVHTLTQAADEKEKDVTKAEACLTATRKESGAMSLSIEDQASSSSDPTSAQSGDNFSTPAPSQDHARSLSTTISHMPAGSLRTAAHLDSANHSAPTKFDATSTTQSSAEEADGFADSFRLRHQVFFAHLDYDHPELSIPEDYNTSVRRFLTFKVLQKSMSGFPERIKAIVNGDCRTMWMVMVDTFTNVSYAQWQLAHLQLLKEHMRAEDTYEEFQQRFDVALNQLLSTGYEFDEASIIQSHVAAISNNAGFTRDIDINALSLYSSYADLVVDLTHHAQEYRNSSRLRDMYKQERAPRRPSEPSTDARGRQEQGHVAKHIDGKGKRSPALSSPPPKTGPPKVGFVKDKLISMGMARIPAKDRVADKLDKPPMAPPGECSTDHNYGGCPFGSRCKYKHVVGKPDDTSVPSSYKCHRCGKSGHWWIFCPADLKAIGSANHAETHEDQAHCSMALQFDDQDDAADLSSAARMATVDSGADRHLFKKRGQFDSIANLSRPVRINLPSGGTAVYAYEGGTVAMQVTDTDECLHTLELKDALLVHDLSSTDVISANTLIPDQVNSISLHNDEMRLDLNTRLGRNSCTVLIPAVNNVYSLASPAAPSETFSSPRRLIPPLPGEQLDVANAYLHGDLPDDATRFTTPSIGDSGASTHYLSRDPYIGGQLPEHHLAHIGGQYDVIIHHDDSAEDESDSQTGTYSVTSQQESAPYDHMHSTFGKKFSSDVTGDGPDDQPSPSPLTMVAGRMSYRSSIPISHGPLGSSLPIKPASPVYLPHRTAIAQLLDHFGLPTPLKEILNIASELQLTQFDVQNLFLSHDSASHQGPDQPSTQALFDSMTSHKLNARNWETICTILDGPASPFTEYEAANLAGFYRQLALICHRNGITRHDIQMFTSMSLAHDLAKMRRIRSEIPPRLIPLVSATDFYGFGRREFKIISFSLLHLHDGYITVGNDFGTRFDASTNPTDLCAQLVATRTIFCWDQLNCDLWGSVDDTDSWGVYQVIAGNDTRAISSAPILPETVPIIAPNTATTSAPALSLSSHVTMALPTSSAKRKINQEDDDDSEDEDYNSDASTARERYWTGLANSSKFSPTAWQMCQCNTCDNCAERLYNHFFSARSCLNSVCTDRTCNHCTEAIRAADVAANAWVVPRALANQGANRLNPEYLAEYTKLTRLCYSYHIDPDSETELTKAYGYSIRHLQGGDEKLPPKASYPNRRAPRRMLPRRTIKQHSIAHGVCMLNRPEEFSDRTQYEDGINDDAIEAIDALNKSFPRIVKDWPNHNLFRSTAEDRYWALRRHDARKFLLTLEQATLLNNQCNPITRLPFHWWYQQSYQADLSAAIIRRNQSRTEYDDTNHHRI